MPVALEFISLIIPISKIEEKYPGGFHQYKEDNRRSLGRKLWYDDYLVRTGAMNPMDIRFEAEEWERLGLVGVAEENGRKFWRNFF